MSDRKPVIIAVAVGGLALAANGAAAVIALSASSAPPEATTFAITGLSAAFIGLIITIVWAFEGASKPALRHERLFTPWSEREAAQEPALFVKQSGRSSLALARVAAPTLAPAASAGRVIYIADWLKAHDAQHA
jgi:hypothetical protein